jgi:hypothetical protein
VRAVLIGRDRVKRVDGFSLRTIMFDQLLVSLDRLSNTSAPIVLERSRYL